MIRAAARLDAFPEYIFFRLEKETSNVEKETGREVLDFGAGDPDVRTSDVYIEKLAEFIREPNSHLYPGFGAEQFKKAVCQWYRRRFGVELEADEVLPLLGAKEGIAHLPLALADAGDEILVPDPGYPIFSEPAQALGAIPIPYDLIAESGFRISARGLEKKMSSRTKYMWVNFPSNPTGAVADAKDLRDVVQLARKNSVAVIYDNAYSDVTFDGYVAPSILQVDGARETAAEIGSFSKTFSFAGFRMGWIAGNRYIIAALAKVKSQFDSGMSLPLQKLGAYALTHPDEAWRAHMIAEYDRRRHVIAEKLKALGLLFELPKAALYIWARIPDSAQDSEDYCMRLLREKQVLFTPGTAYGKNGKRYVRVSICVNIEKIDEYL